MQQKNNFFLLLHQIYLYLCGENMQEMRVLDGQ